MRVKQRYQIKAVTRVRSRSMKRATAFIGHAQMRPNCTQTKRQECNAITAMLNSELRRTTCHSRACPERAGANTFCLRIFFGAPARSPIGVRIQRVCTTGRALAFTRALRQIQASTYPARLCKLQRAQDARNGPHLLPPNATIRDR